MGELETLERTGWDALSGPNGGAFYREYMADDGLMVFPGAVMDKPTAIATIESVQPWSSYELKGIHEVERGDIGLIIYTATATREASPPYRAVMSSVYVRRSERWLLLLHQQSPG
jgi:hypothetical protein